MSTLREKRQAKKERKQRWKAAKKERRAQEKAFYRDAPARVRIWQLYLKKPLFALLILALAAGLVIPAAVPFVQVMIQESVMAFYDTQRRNPVDREKILELSPLDETGAEKIAALPPVDAGDTWTICVYIVGSNLEDMGENDLSDVTSMQMLQTKQSLIEENQQRRLENLDRFTKELTASGLALPEYLYEPVRPVASSTVVTEDVVVADRQGAASADIEEMASGVWSDNIQLVIQTGGARRWSNGMINPNRTQRFLYRSGEFQMVDELPIQPSYEAGTLADFMDFCRTQYPADHQMLVLWNHGGGAFGYGNDSICGGLFSLKDVRSALEQVYAPDAENPPFDVIGFDACLMSSLEVTHALDGFADYYAVSEEVEPGDGWDYGPWLQAMTDDPTMSPARIAQAIADSYTDFYMTCNVNVGMLSNSDVTFSVLDAKKCHELYEAYCDLAKAQLKDAAEDLGVLSELGRCANKATRYAGSGATIINTVDLGGYVDCLIDSYPAECSRIKDLLGEAVLYHRENGSVCDSQGISVYIPAAVDSASGLIYFLDYVYDISEDDSITALYYYKMAGCLNEELLAHVQTMTDVQPKILNTAAFRAFALSKPAMEEEGYSIPISQELQDMLQSYDVEVSQYDRDAQTITNYGIDELAYLDGEGNLCSAFDGQWIFLDNTPLAVEVVSATASAVEYRSKVLYNGKTAYLSFAYDRDSEEFTLTDVREIPSDEEDANYLMNTRSGTQPLAGSKITPVYTVDNLETGDRSEEQGDTVKIGKSTGISLKALPSGYYLSTIVIGDQRGDTYYSAVVGETVSHGRVTDRAVDTAFFGRAY